MLCTIADIKARLGLTTTDHDAVLTQIAAGFTALADRFCGRTLLVTAGDVTEYYTGHCNMIQLRRYPVVSITSIKECYGYNFDDVDPLTADTDYRLIDSGSDNRGVIARLWSSWYNGFDGIQVVYRGGYCAAGVSPTEETNEVALPDDLREAAIEQCSMIFKRRDDIGLSGISFDGGSFSKFTAMDLLPMVKSVLTDYRRLSI